MNINANSINIPLEDHSVQCVITSPPYYGLRDYGSDGQIGLEQTPEEYIGKLLEVFREVWRVLRDDGTVFVVIGDSYAGKSGRGGNSEVITGKGKNASIVDKSKRNSKRRGGGNIPANGKLKPKDLIMIPAMFATTLRDDGWYLRDHIVWFKLNPIPESVNDRCTKSFEEIFMFSKKERYYYDQEVIMEPAIFDGRKDTKYKGSKKYMTGERDRWQFKNLQPKGQSPNTMHINRLNGEEYLSPMRHKRNVWITPVARFSGAHYATFPEELIEPCVLAGCPEGGVILDPFAGAGTTELVAIKHNRKCVGLEINLDYIKIANKRLSAVDVKLPEDKND